MKRPDEELICECGHLYHEHKRKYNYKKQFFEFAHNGPCEICICKKYKEKE